MKTNIYIAIAVIFAALFTMNVEGKSPAKTTKINSVLGQEQRLMVLSHLRANPDPRSVATYNQFMAGNQSQTPTTIAELRF